MKGNNYEKFKFNQCTCPHCNKNFKIKDAIGESLLNDVFNQIRVDIKKRVDIDKLKELKDIKSHYKEKSNDEINEMKLKFQNDLEDKINKITKNFERENENHTLVIEKNLEKEINSLKINADRNLKAKINDAVLSERSRMNDADIKINFHIKKKFKIFSIKFNLYKIRLMYLQIK